MYPDVAEELTWATIREREEEARRARPHTKRRPASSLPLRPCLARTLVHGRLRPDRRVGDLAADYQEPKAAP